MNKYEIYNKSANLIVKKIGKPFEEIVLSPCETNTQIEKLYKSQQSRNTILVGVYMLAKDMYEHGKLHEDVFNEWKQIRINSQKIVNDMYESNEASERQKLGYVPLKEIIRVRETLPISPQKLLLSFYTMIPPARNDYHKLRIFNEIPISLVSGNYVVLGNDNKLFLQEFKTSHKYNTIKIDLPSSLVSLLKKTLDKQPRDYVFVAKSGIPYENEKAFDAWANYNLKKILKNEKITLTMLRHIYITDMCSSGINYKQRAKMSREMGHNVTMQLKYAFMDIQKE